MNSYDRDIVAAFAAALAARLGQRRFATWFAPHVEFRVEGGRLVMAARDAFYREHLRRNFAPLLAEVAQQVCGPQVEIDFVVALPAARGGAPLKPDRPATPAARQAAAMADSEAAPPHDEADTADHADAAGGTLLMERRPAPTRARKFARFDTFVTGPQNLLAESAARRATREPGRLTPLLLHGPSGVGKSHLLEAIWSESRVVSKQAHLIYLKAEQFTAYFLEAVRGGSGMPAFRRKYRGAHLLILDDLQFFTNKPATIMELLHTIDTVHSGGGQVVLAADRAPAELSMLGPELVGRLQAGLACRLDLPDEATRCAIVRRFARRGEAVLAAGVAELIAARLTGDARELAGAVHRLIAYSEAFARPIDLDLATEALRDLFQAAEKPLQISDIEKAVCDTFGLERAALQADRRSQDVAHPRMLAMYLARQLTRAAYSEIGQYFGGRSHSTAISAVQKVDRWRDDRQTLRVRGTPLAIDEAVRRVQSRLRVG